MPALVDLKEELNKLKLIKFITSAFSDTAAIKLKKLKVAFEKNSLFYDEVTHVYALVKKSAAKLKLQRSSALENQPANPLAICITSNHRFYGTLNIDTLERFIKETKNLQIHKIIIGKVGIEDMKSRLYYLPFTPIVFSRDFPEIDEINQFMEQIKHYQPVMVYHPKFKTVLSQTIGVIDISQAPPTEDIKSLELIDNLYEPELPEIVAFFRKRIQTLLFIRALLESELARTAARLMSMTDAEDKANQLIDETKTTLVKTKKSLINRRLLETYTITKGLERL